MLKTLTDNPVPTALVGLGLYWLLKNSSEGSNDSGRCFRDPSVEDQIKEKLQIAKDAVQERLTDLNEQASHQTLQWKEETTRQAYAWKEGSQQKIDEGKKYLQEKTTAARGEFNHLLDSNPLAVGAVMLVLGAAVAAALPGSRKEDQWMGNSREQMMNAVKATVQSTIKDVTNKSGQIAEMVLEEGKQEIK